MGRLTERQLEFLWGYALERGSLKLGAYHEMADAHGVDRVETMCLAVMAMAETPKEMAQQVEDLPPPPPWPFENDPAEILKEIRDAETENGSPQSDR